MSILSLYSLTLAYSDPAQTNNPVLRNADWKRSLPAVFVKNPKTDPFMVGGGNETLIFDGTRLTSIDGTSAFDLSLSTLASDLYRITSSGGTDPILRTARALNLNGIVTTLTVQANGSVLVTVPAGTPFSFVQAGDELMIAGVLTGDASSPFSSLNQGRWTVLAVGGAGANVTLVRPAGQDFQGVTEVVTPTTAAQVYAYSQAGVQAGDKMRLSAGFSAAARKTYVVESVTSKYVEFRSTTPLPAEAGITPGASGMQFFSMGKRFLRVEVDQEATLRINGVLGPELSPWAAADPQMVAEYVQVGPVWSLSIVNRSGQTLNATIISAE